MLALAGDLSAACRAEEIRDAARGWLVVRQDGQTFGERLVDGHRQAHRLAGGPVVQIGMDTPQVEPALLREVAEQAHRRAGPVLGPALDGGWWVLVTTHAGQAGVLAGVPMSRPDTCRLTAAALVADGHPAGATAVLRDVDLPEDAEAVAVGPRRPGSPRRGGPRPETRRHRGLVGSDLDGLRDDRAHPHRGGSTHRRPDTPPDSFTSDLRGPRTTARVGVWLGVAFAVAFATGLYSHASQLATPARAAADRPEPPLPGDPGPARRRRHRRGTPAARQALVGVPPAVREATALRRAMLLLHLLERVSIALLVGAAIFQLVTGLANSAQWYPWPFASSRRTMRVAWVAAGSLLRPRGGEAPGHPSRARRPGPGCRPPGIRAADVAAPTRRTLLRATWLSAGVAVLATTAAELPGLRRVAVLAVRSGQGPQGIPVNRSAVAAGVVGLAR